MERSEISLHEVRVFHLLSGSPERWFTNHEIAEGAKVAQRTARMHSLRFVQLGMLDLADVFPGHRYKWSPNAKSRNTAYVQRLEKAAAVFTN